MADEGTKYSYDFKEAADDISRIEAGLSRVESAISTSQQGSKDLSDSFTKIASSGETTAVSLAKIADYYSKAAEAAKKTEDKTKKMQSQFAKGRQDAEKMVKAFLTLGLVNTKMGKAAGYMAGFAGTANRAQHAITGIDLSLGGIVKLFVEAANLTRKISGLSAQVAMNLGGGFENAQKMRNSMFDLRRTFAMDYDEAAKVLGTLTSMGFAADEVGKKPLIQRNARAEVRSIEAALTKQNNELDKSADALESITTSANQLADTYGNKIGKEVATTFGYSKQEAELSKKWSDQLKTIWSTQEKIAGATEKIAKANAAALASYAKEVSLAKELHAIEVAYGISVKQSGGLIKDLRQNYGQTKDEARGLLGAAISYGEELAASGVPIGIGELLDDWSQIIQYTKVYKTDLLGVMGMYETFVRNTDTAKALGVGALTKEQKMDVMKGLAKAPMEMDIGWKVRFGVGKNPVERMMEFENLTEKGTEGFVEMWKRIVGGVQDMAGDIKTNPKMAEFRARQAFTGTGVFDEETVRKLSKELASGNLDSKKMGLAMDGIYKAQQKAKAAAKNWPTKRLELVESTAKISKNLQNFQAIIKKWLEDNVMKWLQEIYNVLTQILGFFGSGDAQKKLAERGIKSNLAEVGLSPETGQKIAEAASRVGLFGGAATDDFKTRMNELLDYYSPTGTQGSEGMRASLLEQAAKAGEVGTAEWLAGLQGAKTEGPFGTAQAGINRARPEDVESFVQDVNIEKTKYVDSLTRALVDLKRTGERSDRELGTLFEDVLARGNYDFAVRVLGTYQQKVKAGQSTAAATEARAALQEAPAGGKILTKSK